MPKPKNKHRHKAKRLRRESESWRKVQRFIEENHADEGRDWEPDEPVGRGTTPKMIYTPDLDAYAARTCSEMHKAQEMEEEWECCGGKLS